MKKFAHDEYNCNTFIKMIVRMNIKFSCVKVKYLFCVNDF